MAIHLQPAADASTRPLWFWPVRVPHYITAPILSAAIRLGRWLGPWPNWALAGLLIGAGPYAGASWLGLTFVNLLSAVLLVAVVAAAAAEDSLAKGLLVLGGAYLAHSGVTLALAFFDPQMIQRWFPVGMAYWEKSRLWIMTGDHPEYDPAYWLPVHVVLIVGMVAAAYPTFGLVAFYHGFRQVDLMNCYVGRLAAMSDQPWTALTLGWHPWSVLRGLGFAVILFEVTSLSLGRLTGARISSAAWRRRRWLAGLFLLACDALIKYAFLDAVREQLAANLNVSG